jgi:hypothetical protein
MGMDWDLRYRTGDTPWDKGRAHPALATAAIAPNFSGNILVPGCGRGWDVRELAMRFPRATVSGIDLSIMAIQSAAEVCEGLSNVKLRLGDFLDPSDETASSANLIWEHTCFCALPPDRRSDYVAAAAHHLVPGGHLAGVFFLQLDDGGSGPPWNTPEAEFCQLFQNAFEIEPPRPVVETFAGRDGEERLVWMTRRR